MKIIVEKRLNTISKSDFKVQNVSLLQRCDDVMIIWLYDIIPLWYLDHICNILRYTALHYTIFDYVTLNRCIEYYIISYCIMMYNPVL